MKVDIAEDGPDFIIAKSGNSTDIRLPSAMLALLNLKGKKLRARARLALSIPDSIVIIVGKDDHAEV